MNASLAIGHRSLGDPDVTYPLEPVPTAGCPETSTDDVQYPVGVEYAYGDVDLELFDPRQPVGPGLERWQPLLPPLAVDTLGEGATPAIDAPRLAEWLDLEELLSDHRRNDDPTLVLKDESQNPTWSHKDRLNRCTVSAAVVEEATGIVASSTGNHGAAAAAYAARAGLPCVVFTAPETPSAVQAFIRSYGAVLLAVDDIGVRQEAVDHLADDHGFHPVSSRTGVHTGHAWGPEGYKTIAYELYCRLEGRAPGTVVIPTCYAELLYGIWKGFRELEALGVADRTPRLVAAEPGVRAPLREALVAGDPVRHVDAAPTEAYSIKATTSSIRGFRALEESDGLAVGFSEAQLEAAQHRLARTGFWQESSGAAAIAGLLALRDDPSAAVDASGTPVGEPQLEAPVVSVMTSSGFKDGAALPGDRTHGDGWYEAPRPGTSWAEIREALEVHDRIPLEG